MAKKIDQYYKQNLKSTKGSTNSVINANNQATDAYVSSTNKSYDDAIKKSKQDTAVQKDALRQDYQRSYDMNAISKAVAQRQLRERMAATGLSDSGLNRTQLTALETAKMNNDNAVTRQQTAAKATLESALADTLAKLRSEKAGNEAQVRYTNAQKNNEIKQNYYTNAYNNAVSQYSEENAAEKAAEAEKYKAAQEAATKTTIAMYNAQAKKKTTSELINDASDMFSKQTVTTSEGDTSYRYSPTEAATLGRLYLVEQGALSLGDVGYNAQTLKNMYMYGSNSVRSAVESVAHNYGSSTLISFINNEKQAAAKREKQKEREEKKKNGYKNTSSKTSDTSHK